LGEKFRGWKNFVAHGLTTKTTKIGTPRK